MVTVCDPKGVGEHGLATLQPHCAKPARNTGLHSHTGFKALHKGGVVSKPTASLWETLQDCLHTADPSGTKELWSPWKAAVPGIEFLPYTV